MFNCVRLAALLPQIPFIASEAWAYHTNSDVEMNLCKCKPAYGKNAGASWLEIIIRQNISVLYLGSHPLSVHITLLVQVFNSSRTVFIVSLVYTQSGLSERGISGWHSTMGWFSIFGGLRLCDTTLDWLFACNIFSPSSGPGYCNTFPDSTCQISPSEVFSSWQCEANTTTKFNWGFVIVL